MDTALIPETNASCATPTISPATSGGVSSARGGVPTLTQDMVEPHSLSQPAPTVNSP